MKKIKKVGWVIVIFLLFFYNTCFADLVWVDPLTGEVHGGGTLKPSVPESTRNNYIIAGILVLIIVACAVIIIRRIIKKKKEKINVNK